MPIAKNIRKCTTLLNQISKKEYFRIFKRTIDAEIQNLERIKISSGMSQSNAEREAYKDILNYLSNVLQNGQTNIDAHINNKIQNGEISNADQARKSVAGNLFQQSIAYLLAKNVILGNITKPIIVTTSVKSLLDQYAQINVNGDVQTPDSDIIIYSETTNSPILNISCKTSFRERAGQTYKWKLLFDLATCTCPHKPTQANCPATVYNLTYTPSKPVKVGFITADFYNEINNPQIVGMFSFFDYAYITKTIGNTGIISLSNILNDINNLF